MEIFQSLLYNISCGKNYPLIITDHISYLKELKFDVEFINYIL